MVEKRIVLVEVEELVVEELVVLVRKSGELVEKLKRKLEESRREV